VWDGTAGRGWEAKAELDLPGGCEKVALMFCLGGVSSLSSWEVTTAPPSAWGSRDLLSRSSPATLWNPLAAAAHVS
jgi:hypothetical protein